MRAGFVSSESTLNPSVLLVPSVLKESRGEKQGSLEYGCLQRAIPPKIRKAQTTNKNLIEFIEKTIDRE
jgi:hypothetical protein